MAAALVRPRETEGDDLLQRALHRRGREQRQRIDRHGAVVLRTAQRIFQRTMLGHQSDRMIEITVPDLATLQRAHPEGALTVIAAAESQHDWERDLAFAEIVADIFAELSRLAAIIEHIVDELE